MAMKVVKRDGSIVDFNTEKIERAVSKAQRATGIKHPKLAVHIARKVAYEVKATYTESHAPTVENIQDLVEKALINEGQAPIAKAYIIYRKEREQIREEKKKILEKDTTDEVDKLFDVNALRVLKARYLRKDERGRLIETPKQLFTRIAVHTALPDIMYDPIIFSKKEILKQHEVPSQFDHISCEGKFAIGKYQLNQWHIEALWRMYGVFNTEQHIKVPWQKFLKLLDDGAFVSYEKNIDEFYESMVQRSFMPNTPAIANFGNVLGMGSACFVLGVDDSMISIMDTLKDTAVIHQSGGGTGFNFSHLRHEGDFVKSTSGYASGPVSFIQLYDKLTEVVKQGGMRRGANMGILNSDHPDIEKFITAKRGNQALRNFNISVFIKADFWKYYNNNKPYPLRNSRTNEIIRYVNPKTLFDLIVYQAWESAEPGVIYDDHVNKYNPLLKSLGPIETTNPCGEVLLYRDESCNLGSINVWNFYDRETKEFQWTDLKKIIKMTTRFLDNIIDVNKFPLQKIQDMTRYTRKIGLGVMGVADVLYEMELPYDSAKGRAFVDQLMEYVNFYSKEESIALAKERGVFPAYDKSFYPDKRMPIRGFDHKKSWRLPWDTLIAKINRYGIRNAYSTVVAPTGSISMIAGCSSGIEPVYSLMFEKNVKVGSFSYINTVFEKRMREEGLYDEKLLSDLTEGSGGVQHISYISPKLKKVFVTAMDIKPEDHIRMLAVVQKWVDSSVSKTNNFPANATIEDMRESYLLAHKLGVKDVTVFRDTSIKDQVLVAVKKNAESSGDIEHHSLAENINKSKLCPECAVELIRGEGCLTCPSCGYGRCE
ncbi:MAG: adenosylcobalamin-dependent ribonucleoside-diphosphate reductase [Parcubacteria group bacterium]|nr:adenosylcobalamin-dependent ribonucleoside-diphosphate reductase [Parcubacteria group bacterium]